MSVTENKRRITGVVLAGGLSSRMGQDKALLPCLDADSPYKNQLQRSAAIMEQLKNKGDISQWVISRREPLNLGFPFETQFIADTIAEKGPLGAIYTLLAEVKNDSDFILLLPVDLPLLTASDLVPLIEMALSETTACYYQQHFLPLLLPVNDEIFEYVREQVIHSDGNLSIRGLLKEFPSQAVPYDEEVQKFLTNANTPEQWQAIQKQI